MNKAKWDNKGIIDGKCMLTEEWGSMDLMKLWLNIRAVSMKATILYLCFDYGYIWSL